MSSRETSEPTSEYICVDCGATVNIPNGTKDSNLIKCKMCSCNLLVKKRPERSIQVDAV
ncbi:hypothetical protein TVAG_283180 [Trichomonas vaginalis G3]|uniref:Uncharacterized protein n=1 Tax=Trichomonas vaginalis (strain ATCC PRA-98 / G3) TaxID=412133 RepID=A2DEM1_TRIV3|nr:RNA polymerase ii, chain L domain-containing protein [Trichomonas vaginalis G3]EAY21148.1 hypothetical protein TVAG_283180 [Trichomonas vaginalis G3]KAI5522327.1 RNA polymerase ii, chain L domain-containing protein [Trichomonas vaginalis G3]|eukprot:XP_001582134.1 hypothetical protein [Trichomonas vaginalis G3]